LSEINDWIGLDKVRPITLVFCKAPRQMLSLILFQT